VAGKGILGRTRNRNDEGVLSKIDRTTGPSWSGPRGSSGSHLYERCTLDTTICTAVLQPETFCMKLHVEDNLLYQWCN
jgi:hypothetical protein